jgi:hypothetical protein
MQTKIKKKTVFYGMQNRGISVPNTHGQFCTPPPGVISQVTPMPISDYPRSFLYIIY